MSFKSFVLTFNPLLSSVHNLQLRFKLLNEEFLAFNLIFGYEVLKSFKDLKNDCGYSLVKLGRVNQKSVLIRLLVNYQ